MKKEGLPDHLALAVAELCEALAFETEILEHDEVVKARDVSITVAFW